MRLSLPLLISAMCTMEVLAGFVFSPPRKQVAEQGKQMGERLRTVLPVASEQVASEPEKQLEPAIDEAKENEEASASRQELLVAASLFNDASSQNTEEQQATEDALREALSTPSHVGSPARQVTNSEPTTCLPDLAQCPRNWIRKGVLCIASGEYSGSCASEADFSEMSSEQKLAFANVCEAIFPCQAECKQDFQQVCPSLWREIDKGICSAPGQYEGGCPMRLNVSSMGDEDKYAFSVRCGARWPCSGGSLRRNYQDICPSGWSLQYGQTCAAPATYDGPCEKTAFMAGVSAAEKKRFEATCEAEWPAIGAECVPNYAAPCPFGWLSIEAEECIAPQTYARCASTQMFDGMSPADKEDWAKTCQVEFPCRDRAACKKGYFSPCPADWYALNGGMTCVAPESYKSYAANCSPVMHGLLDLSLVEKVELEKTCSLSWPCLGEMNPSSLQTDMSSLAPRSTRDPAMHSAENGAIDSISGAIMAHA